MSFFFSKTAVST